MTVALPDKPRFGTPCNGCGVCCSMEICIVGKLVFPDRPGPCPALRISKDRTRTYCNFAAVEIENRMKPVIQATLGINVGCSMSDDDTTDEELRMLDALRDQKYKTHMPANATHRPTRSLQSPLSQGRQRATESAHPVSSDPQGA